jgi:hypothetical protein
MPTLSLASVIEKSSNQVSTNLGKETVILGLTSEEYYSLKDVGAQIWALIDGPTSVQAILEALLKKYAVEPARCQADLLAILQEMVGEGLIEVR